MPLNFPSNPTANETTYTDGVTVWLYTGQVWEIVPDQSPTFTNITVTGTITGNVTGTVSSIANHDIGDLSDVEIASPTNNQVLSYNSSVSRWQNFTLSSTFTGGTVPNAINVTSTTVSTNSTTGALRVAGGVGIQDDLFVGGNINVEDEYLSLRTRSEIRFYDSDNSNYVGFKSADTINTNKIWVLPTIDGDAGQYLQTDGAGTLSWASGAGGGQSTPGGSNTQIQYNNNGVLAGNAGFTFTSGTSTVNLVTLTASGILTVTNNTASTTAATGAVVVTGGVGISGQVNIAGATNKFTANTASTTTTTGAVVISGGLGVGGQITVGGNVNINTDPTIASHATTKSYVDAKSLALAMAFGV
jgi:hypothetical protein